MSDVIEDHLAWCREQRAKAADTLRHIDEDGWTFHHARGNEPMQDVTEERAAHQRNVIENMDRIIAAYERGAR